MNSTNFRSIVIFARCVVGTRNIRTTPEYMGEFLLGGVLFFVHYNGKCWYLYLRCCYFRWGILI